MLLRKFYSPDITDPLGLQNHDSENDFPIVTYLPKLGLDIFQGIDGWFRILEINGSNSGLQGAEALGLSLADHLSQFDDPSQIHCLLDPATPVHEVKSALMRQQLPPHITSSLYIFFQAPEFFGRRYDPVLADWIRSTLPEPNDDDIVRIDDNIKALADQIYLMELLLHSKWETYQHLSADPLAKDLLVPTERGLTEENIISMLKKSPSGKVVLKPDGSSGGNGVIISGDYQEMLHMFLYRCISYKMIDLKSPDKTTNPNDGFYEYLVEIFTREIKSQAKDPSSKSYAAVASGDYLGALRHLFENTLAKYDFSRDSWEPVKDYFLSASANYLIQPYIPPVNLSISDADDICSMIRWVTSVSRDSLGRVRVFHHGGYSRNGELFKPINFGLGAEPERIARQYPLTIMKIAEIVTRSLIRTQARVA